MKAEIVAATIEHVIPIAERMREADKREMWAAACVRPLEAVEKSFKSSMLSWTGLIDGVPVCMFGVAPSDLMAPSIGRPWMLGTDLIDRYPRTFLRRCRESVQQMLDRFPELVNYVDARNTLTIQWLKWLGFSLLEPSPMGPFSIPFCRFELRR